jgi:hypothetical protein
MNKQRVNAEQAKMLRQVGYDVPCDSLYQKETLLGTMFIGGVDDYNRYQNVISAPTLDDAARWLREVKGWHVVVMQKNNGDWMAMPETTPRSYSNLFIDNQPDHDTALSEGITLILKKLTDVKTK